MTFQVHFEFVSVESHPEHYCCTGQGHTPQPLASEFQVPDAHWVPVVVDYDLAGDAYAHYVGLLTLANGGELIRRMYVSEA